MVATSNGIDILDDRGFVIESFDEILKKFNVNNSYTRVVFEESKKNIWIGKFLDGGLFRVNINCDANAIERFVIILLESI